VDVGPLRIFGSFGRHGVVPTNRLFDVAMRSFLVGREEERRLLVEALEGCRSGVGGLVLISGEAGIGKSRLVDEVLSSWEGRCLSATASSGAGRTPPCSAR